jgi:hypothetical protein
MHRNDLTFGLESEYAVMSVDRSVDRRQWACGLLDFIASRTSSVADGCTRGLYVPFGRVYLDSGGHPEFASAPATNPWDLLLCQRLFESLAIDYARQANDTTYLVRTNIDYLSETQWGSHDNIQIDAINAEGIAHRLVPYLATRCIFTGAGGFHVNARANTVSFTMSPRACTDVGAALYSFKYMRRRPEKRLHITCGENCISDISLMLKVVVPALLVRLAESVPHVFVDMPALKDPIASMKQLSDRWWRDLRCPLPLSDNSMIEALAVQQRYFALLQGYEDAPFMPPWTDFVLGLWKELLDDFSSCPVSAHPQLDWMIKAEYFNTFLEQYYGCRLDSLDSQKPPKEVFHHLFKLDSDFGRLTTNAYSSQLRQEGIMAPLPYLPEVSMDYHPMQGNANERAAVIRDLANKPGDFVCKDWDFIFDRKANQVVHSFVSGIESRPYSNTRHILEHLDTYIA